MMKQKLANQVCVWINGGFYDKREVGIASVFVFIGNIKNEGPWSIIFANDSFIR